MNSITADDIKKIGQIREKLLDCSTKNDVDGIFCQFNITDFPVKTILLRQSMQMKEVFDVPNDESLSDEDIYEEEVDFLLDGKWRDLI